jgi:nucleoside-diphosphate-sugar epimerase
MTRVLITGIMGFIGSHLAQRLVDDRMEVYGLERRVASRNMAVLADLLQDITLVSGDVSDYVSVRNAVKTVNPDVIIHLAALSPVRDSFERPFEYQQANYIGTMNVAHSLLELQDPQTRRLIAASTAEVYGIQANEPLKETLPLHPSSPYAVSKAAGDVYLQMMFNSFNLKGTIMRPTNSYGRKFDTSFLVEYLVTKMLRGEKIYIGSPDSVRDYMYVDDHVNGYFLAMKNPEKANGQIFNVGTAFGVSNKDIALLIAKKVGFDPKNIALGAYPPGYPLRPLMSDQKSIVLDSAKIRKELGWKPAVTLEEGIAKVVAYFKQGGKK